MADTEFSFSTVVISLRILVYICFASLVSFKIRISNQFSITIIGVGIQYGGWFQFLPCNKWRHHDVSAMVKDSHVLANLSDNLFLKYFSFYGYF